jgi:hypothetical protein
LKTLRASRTEKPVACREMTIRDRGLELGEDLLERPPLLDRLQ